MNHSRVPHRRLAAALLCAGALAPVAAADAAPASGLKKATFKVTVEGVQTTSWKTDHPGGGGCDGAVTGSGTEKVRFASRPTVVNATVLKGLSAPVLAKRGAYVEAKPALRGKVTRQGTLDAPPGPCGGTGGGTNIPRDCGTKSFRGVGFPLAYALAVKPKDQLDVRPEFIDDPFKNCPSGGSSFPTLVRTNEGRPIRALLPRKELFDRSLGKIIVIARGKESETQGEHTYVTKIRWVVTFVRLDKKRG
jgi:hypothetical protein